MSNTWLFQLTISISIILSTSLVVKKLLEITLSKSFLVSISFITLFIMLLNILGLYKFSINILIIISIIPFFFSSIRKIILEEKSLIIEFILLILAIFYFSHDRIFMDEDELYFWAVKYKYFIIQLNELNYNFGNNNYKFDNITNIYEYSGYGNATSIFQAFITSFIGYNEGGAIFANNIIIICSFYFLFGDKVKKFNFRILYFLIVYLILNNLSFGLLSIYNDPIVVSLYAVLVYYLINDFNYKKLKSIILIVLLIIFFINIHRISILFACFLLILIHLKYYKNKINSIKSIFVIGFYIFFTFIIIRLTTTYDSDITKYIVNLNFNEIIFILKTVFLTKSYNSQFGVSFNEIINFFQINLRKIPEYIWHNLIWYAVCLTIAFINGKKTQKINIFFLIIFLIFANIIIVNKFYIQNVSPNAFGRYISFILIPYIFVNLIYLESLIKKKYIILFFVAFFLAFSTPKKTFGFFFTKDYYSKFDLWNKNYYEVREKHKRFFTEIQNIYKNKTYKALVISEEQDSIYKAHPSLYQSALKLDLYPNEIETLIFDRFIHKEFNRGHFLQKADIIIYYNLGYNEKKTLKKLIKKNKYNKIVHEFDFNLRN